MGYPLFEVIRPLFVAKNMRVVRVKYVSHLRGNGAHLRFFVKKVLLTIIHVKRKCIKIEPIRFCAVEQINDACEETFRHDWDVKSVRSYT